MGFEHFNTARLSSQNLGKQVQDQNASILVWSNFFQFYRDARYHDYKVKSNMLGQYKVFRYAKMCFED